MSPFIVLSSNSEDMFVPYIGVVPYLEFCLWTPSAEQRRHIMLRQLVFLRIGDLWCQIIWINIPRFHRVIAAGRAERLA